MPKKSCKRTCKKTYKKSCKKTSKNSKKCKSKTHKQKLYNMKGCSNCKCKKNNCVCNKKSKQKGGNLVRNIFRDLGNNVNTAYNGIRGIPAPVNPLPYNGQYANSKSVLV